MSSLDESTPWCLGFDACNGVRLLVFSSWHAAARHVADHMLTHPEGLAWSLLIPAESVPLDLTDRDRCWEAACRLVDGRAWPDASGRQFYRAYAEVVRAAATKGAAACGEFSGGTAYLGLSGVIVIATGDRGHQVVRTAFVAGAGSSPAVVESRADYPSRSATPRQTDLAAATRRPDHRRTGHGGAPPDVLRLPTGRREDGSRERQIYLRLFRPAAQFVRRQHLGGAGLNSGGNDYGVLKAPLGPMSRWDFDTWSRQWSAAVTDKTSGETP